MPKFSVIIPLYNKASYIGSTLQSVLAQNFVDYEIVIVDDGSTDKSPEIVKKISDSRIRLFQQENKGASAARNKAMQEAAGKYFAFLDADDLWRSNHLEEINKLISRYPEEKVFATAIELEDSQGTYPAPYFGISSEKYQLLDFFDASYGQSILSGSSTVVHRDVIEKVGFFNESIHSGQDTDFWIRLGLKYKIAFINVCTVIYKWVPESLSRKAFNLQQKIDFTIYDEEAKNNPYLAKFINYNRFSFWIQSKMAGDNKSADSLKQKIQPEYLSQKQRLLLQANPNQLKFLYKIKELLKSTGIRFSIFGK